MAPRINPRSATSASTHRRLAGLALFGLAVALVAPACSSSPSATASLTSEPRPAAPSDEFASPGDPGADESIPGLGDIEDELGEQFDDLTGELGDLGDCADLGLAYSQLVVIAFTSDDPSGEIDAVIGELKDEAPDELQDDLQVVADTLADAGEGGILDATGAMSDPAFTEANEAITTWITTQCGGG